MKLISRKNKTKEYIEQQSWKIPIIISVVGIWERANKTLSNKYNECAFVHNEQKREKTEQSLLDNAPNLVVGCIIQKRVRLSAWTFYP